MGNKNALEMWVDSYSFHFPSIQKEATKLLNSLINAYFYKNSEYAVEKLVKTFVENLLFLESTLLKQRGVHPQQQKSKLLNPIEQAEKVQHLTEIEKIILTETHRLFRHYNIIFTSIRPITLKKCN